MPAWLSRGAVEPLHHVIEAGDVVAGHGVDQRALLVLLVQVFRQVERQDLGQGLLETAGQLVHAHGAHLILRSSLR